MLGQWCKLVARIASRGLAIISGSTSKLRVSPGKIEAKTVKYRLTRQQKHGRIGTSKGDLSPKGFSNFTIRSWRRGDGVKERHEDTDEEYADCEDGYRR